MLLLLDKASGCPMAFRMADGEGRHARICAGRCWRRLTTRVDAGLKVRRLPRARPHRCVRRVAHSRPPSFRVTHAAYMHIDTDIDPARVG